MKSTDEDLFKPLSAKVGRKRYGPGGRELTAGDKRMGDGNRVKNALLRAKKGSAQGRKGKLQ